MIPNKTEGRKQQRTIINKMENRKNRENSINQEVGSLKRSIKLANSRLRERGGKLLIQK